MEVDGKVRQQEILSKDERDLERTEREEIESDEERKENKKTLNKNGIAVHTLSYSRAYCSMSQNFKTFNTANEGLFLCLVCQMYQIFGIWHI